MAVRKALEEQKREVEALKREKLEKARVEEIETLRRQLLNVPLGSFAESAVSTSHKTDEVSWCQARQGTTLCIIVTVESKRQKKQKHCNIKADS